MSSWGLRISFHFSRSDVHSSIDLSAVSGNDFAVPPLRYLDRKRRLARRRGTENGDESWKKFLGHSCLSYLYVEYVLLQRFDCFRSRFDSERSFDGGAAEAEVYFGRSFWECVQKVGELMDRFLGCRVIECDEEILNH